MYWQKVYGLPQLSRESRGRAIVNLLSLAEDEKIADCRAVRNFDLEDHFLVMATKSGLVKKTALSAYGRPKKGGIIAIKLRDDDELIDIGITKPGDELVLSTAQGMAIRFSQEEIRAMGRNTSGVKGISLAANDQVVGMVVADPAATLLTVCEHGYGKRTPFGPHAAELAAETQSEDDELSSSSRYRTQKRGGKGLRDIKTTARNGQVISINRVDDGDEILMMTARGKIQRVAVDEIGVIGRNTQGVRIMSLDDGDSLAGIVRVPQEEEDESKVDAPAPETANGSQATVEPPEASDDTGPEGPEGEEV